jgi:hypothetical protein
MRGICQKSVNRGPLLAWWSGRIHHGVGRDHSYTSRQRKLSGAAFVNRRLARPGICGLSSACTEETILCSLHCSIRESLPRLPSARRMFPLRFENQLRHGSTSGKRGRHCARAHVLDFCPMVGVRTRKLCPMAIPPCLFWSPLDGLGHGPRRERPWRRSWC